MEHFKSGGEALPVRTHDTLSDRSDLPLLGFVIGFGVSALLWGGVGWTTWLLLSML